MTDLLVVAVPAHVGSQGLAALSAAMTPAELRSVAQLRRPADRARAVAGRGAARLLLGRALEVAPGSVDLVVGLHGKPELGPSHDRRWRFNVSHSGDLALVALSWERSVGVDIEWLPALPPVQDVGPLLWSSVERPMVDRLPVAQMRTMTLQAWVVKEALVKALGSGLQAALTSFTVLASPSAGAAALRSEVADHRLSLLDLGDDYCAAIAVGGTDMPVAIPVETMASDSVEEYFVGRSLRSPS